MQERLDLSFLARTEKAATYRLVAAHEQRHRPARTRSDNQARSFLRFLHCQMSLICTVLTSIIEYLY